MGNVRRASGPVCLVVLLAAVGVACGGGDDGAAAAERVAERREEYIDAFLTRSDAQVVFEGRCLNGTLVDGFGIERLEEEVGTPEEIRADRDLLVDALVAMAADVVDRDMVRAMYECPGARERTVTELAGDDASSKERACVDGALTEDFLVWFWATVMGGLGGEEPAGFEERLRDQFGDCGVLP